MTRAANIIACRIILAGLGFVTPAWSASPRVEFSNPPVEVKTYDFAEIVIGVTDPGLSGDTIHNWEPKYVWCPRNAPVLAIILENPG